MKRFFCTLVVALLVAGCGPQRPDLTPQDKILVNATAVVVALGTLQHAAIELNKQPVCNAAQPPVCNPLVSTSNKNIVVDGVVDALRVMGPKPINVQGSVVAALDVIERRLDAAGRTQLLPYIQAVKAVLQIVPFFKGDNDAKNDTRDLAKRHAARFESCRRLAGAHGAHRLAYV